MNILYFALYLLSIRARFPRSNVAYTGSAPSHLAFTNVMSTRVRLVLDSQGLCTNNYLTVYSNIRSWVIDSRQSTLLDAPGSCSPATSDVSSASYSAWWWWLILIDRSVYHTVLPDIRASTGM